MHLQVRARETIKPAYPTPPHLRNFRLSLIDQINFPISVRTIFLYKAEDNRALTTALIRTYARAPSRSNLGYSRLSLSVHAMNVRPAPEPPLPDNSVGNSLAHLTAQTSEKEIETLLDLVYSLRKAKAEFRRNGLKTLLENKSIFDIPQDFCTFSSIVNFPYYEVADFGWGKPVHLTFPNYVLSNLIIIMDTTDGKGIEVLVTLSPKDIV
ncbi:hypothetical protein CISIN_1g038120mg [Citrus sinensis]|uniref:Uncharacterized protein n=1 Tax=Citrus sinensis TaxID=2711 RepID=A0A067DRM2_CITSI|nr:hypothetical protein CISIN_1g038120mg [Citrus sinensis]